MNPTSFHLARATPPEGHEGQHRGSASRRSSSLVLGVMLGAGAVLLLPLLGACLCNPPSPPRTRDCARPATDFSGVTDVSIVEARAVNGAQGGQHFQFQLRVSGTGLGNCIAQNSTLLEGSSPLDSSGVPVEASPEAGGIVTSPIILFPSTRFDRVVTLRVETLGRTLEQPVSLDPFVPPLDAAVGPDSPEAPDR
jgi:hypothetical protein